MILADKRTTGLRELDIYNEVKTKPNLSLEPMTRLLTASSRGLVQILQVLLNLASHQDVEHDQQGDRQDDVEDGVDPEHVDIEVPVVDPDAVSHQG